MMRLILVLLTLGALTVGLAGCHAEGDIGQTTSVGLAR